MKSHPKLQSALGRGTGDYQAKLPLDQKLYFQYYVQDDTEVGTLMDTKIPIKEVRTVFTYLFLPTTYVQCVVRFLCFSFPSS